MATKKENTIVYIIIGIVILLLVVHPGGIPLGKQEPSVVNKGVFLKPIIVDKDGNVIQELGAISNGGSPTDAFSIVANEASTGYIVIDNVNNFLAFETAMDNSGGDSVVTLTSLTASNPCSSGNPLIAQPSCTGITNVFGPSLEPLWNSQFPLSLNPGQSSGIINSNGMSLASIEFGLIDFIATVDGTYIDANNQEQPLVGAGGKVTLKVAAEQCTDATTADTDSSDADSGVYCSLTNKGKYCRVGAFGNTELTDKASLCGCDSGFEPLGEVCVPTTDCRDTWGSNSCEPGGVRYCNSDGTITYECATCGYTNCPTNANGDSATGCQPDTNSECVYPAVAGSGFLVDIAAPNIALRDECGDGVKAGTEQCDGSDFGGQTCLSLGYSGGTLSCTASCTYNEASCISSYKVLFRTTDLSYLAGSAIGYTSSCGSTLTQYGYVTASGLLSGDCATGGKSWCSATTQIMGNLPGGYKSGGEAPSLWDTSVSGQVCMCDSGSDGKFKLEKYTHTDDDAGKVPDYADPTEPYTTGGQEVSCS